MVAATIYLCTRTGERIPVQLPNTGISPSSSSSSTSCLSNVKHTAACAADREHIADVPGSSVRSSRSSFVPPLQLCTLYLEPECAQAVEQAASRVLGSRSYRLVYQDAVLRLPSSSQSALPHGSASASCASASLFSSPRAASSFSSSSSSSSPVSSASSPHRAADTQNQHPGLVCTCSLVDGGRHTSEVVLIVHDRPSTTASRVPSCVVFVYSPDSCALCTLLNLLGLEPP
jgi:hypothetical protein